MRSTSCAAECCAAFVSWRRSLPSLRRKTRSPPDPPPRVACPHAPICLDEGERRMIIKNTGTKDDPWQLKTAPGTSEYTMYRDDSTDPPQLVCQVGATKLTYHTSAIDDLHAWLKAQG